MSLEESTILKSRLDIYMTKISMDRANAKILYNFTSGWQYQADSPADYSGIVFNYLYTSGEHFYNNIVDVDLLGSGNGYSSPPTVIFSDPRGMGSGASGIGLLDGGKVTGVNMVSGGENYTIDPSVTFSGGGYSELASGTAVLTPEIFRSDAYPAIGYISHPNVVIPRSSPSFGGPIGGPSSGYFNEKDGLFIPEKINYDNFLLMIDYEEPIGHYNPGLSGNQSPLDNTVGRIIATSTTSKEDPSGCIIGVNGANKLFFEYTSKNNLRKVFTLDAEMSSKNLVAINKSEGSVQLNYFDYINNEIYSEDFALSDQSNIIDYTPGEWWTIGQWNRTGVFEDFWYGAGSIRLPDIDGYKGFSGHIDSFLLISGNVASAESLQTLSEIFFLTGIDTNRYSDEVIYYPLPTGVIEEIVTSGSGLIGSYMRDFEITDYSGRRIKIRDSRPKSGLIYTTESVYQSGTTSGSHVERTFLDDEYFFDDSHIISHGKNGILMNDRSGDTMFPTCPPAQGNQASETIPHMKQCFTDQIEIYNSSVKNTSNLGIYGSFLHSISGSGYVSFDNDETKATAQNAKQTKDFIDGFIVYKNGYLQSSGLHYTVENLGNNSPVIVGLGYGPTDVFRCDKITGAQFWSGVTNSYPWTATVGYLEGQGGLFSTPLPFDDNFVILGVDFVDMAQGAGGPYANFDLPPDAHMNKDLYFNGCKLMSGQQYFYSGTDTGNSVVPPVSGSKNLVLNVSEIINKPWLAPFGATGLSDSVIAFIPAYENYYQILGEAPIVWEQFGPPFPSPWTSYSVGHDYVPETVWSVPSGSSPPWGNPFYRFSQTDTGSIVGTSLINLINEKVWLKGELLEHKSGYLRLSHDSINSGAFTMSPKSGRIMNLYN